MKKAVIYINYPNIVVLKSYLDVIEASLTKIGYDCVFVKSLEGIDRTSLIVHPMGVDAFKYYWKGYKNFILWQQGATADESYMRNQSKLRRWVINAMDVFAMKKARFVLYVSDYMRQHYESLAGCLFSNKSYLMPCFNEEFDSSVFDKKKYNKVFTYAGSLDLWQCFNQTVDLYKKIEDRVPNTMFKVLTFNVEEGKRILNEKGVRNYIVKCVPKEEVKKELLETAYGFILREDNMVNRVATPTKFSSYLSAGVIPIFSDCLKDFTKVSSDMMYAYPVRESYTVEQVVNFVGRDIDPSRVKEEFQSLFENYYSAAKHTSNLVELFKGLKL